jgi:membrane protease YdiL (CAAX protease family)
METKKAFLILFFFSLIIFFISVNLEFLFGYIFAMHMGMFCLALYFLTDIDINGLLTKIGIPGSLKTNIIYTIGGLAVVFITLLFLSLIMETVGLNDQEKIIEVANKLPIPVLIIAAFFAPVSEEFFFRAFLYNKIWKLADRFGLPFGWQAGVILSSIIFGLFHFAYGSIVEIIGAIVIGIIFALVYRKSGSIIPVILIHMIYNITSITFLRVFV